MNAPDFEQFDRDARAQGFDEVIVKRWAPLKVLDEHTHPFSVMARVVQGEMWLTAGQHSRHLRPGDGFELAAEAPHAERQGPEGATHWVARRHRPTAR